mgnify:FL=1
MLKNQLLIVLNLSYRNWKLILVDDGTPDNSGIICNEYALKDNRIRVVHQKNGGPGKARNTGIELCDTLWFTFIDADDKIMPTYLENFHVETCKSNEILSVQGFKRVDLQGNLLGEEFNFTEGIYSGDLFLETSFIENSLYNYGQSVGKLYNKALCDKFNVRLNTEIHWSEDHLFYLQYMIHVNEIHTHAGSLYLYQFDESQPTLTHRLLSYKEALKIFHSIYPAANALVKKFDLKDDSVLQKINYHSVTAGFSLVIWNLYREEEDKCIRMQVLRNLRGDMNEMKNKYNPNGAMARLLKYAILYLPVSFLDTILQKKCK